MQIIPYNKIKGTLKPCEFIEKDREAMLKRAGILLLAMALALTMALPAAAGAENFKKVNTYEEGTLYGVSPEYWFYDNAKTAYELGLMKGSNGSFDAWSNITLAETITIAARMHSIYETGKGDFVQGSPWYRVYVDYALAEGILLFEYDDYNKAATRAEFAYILSRALPGEALPAINTVEDGGIPDVYTGAEYYDAVYMLYRAGVLTGNDAGGAFAPKSKIERAAVAAIITRMADPSLRRSITLKKPAELSASEIYAKCAPAVFYIETFALEGKPYATGSGFFIDESGIAITNYHVLENALSAKVKLTDGRELDVSGVLFFDKEVDYAVIRIDGNGFEYLRAGDSSKVGGGDKIYAIGNPQGLTSTLSDGLVSNPRRDDYGGMIQITAPISPGSSGGALIDRFGRVIGITTGSIVSGQSLNFAVPINDVLSKDAEPAEYLDYYSLYTLQKFTEMCTYYDYLSVPSLGEQLYYEEEFNGLRGYANSVKNGTSVHGVLDADLMSDDDIFVFYCNTPGTISVELYPARLVEGFSEANMYMQRFWEVNEKIESKIFYNMQGAKGIMITHTVSEPGRYILIINSKNLTTKLQYAFYYKFTPDKPDWIE